MRIFRLEEYGNLENLRRALAGNDQDHDEARVRVRSILEAVRREGDDALLRFTREFDGVDLSQRGLKVTSAEVEGSLQPRQPGFRIGRKGHDQKRHRFPPQAIARVVVYRHGGRGPRGAGGQAAAAGRGVRAGRRCRLSFHRHHGDCAGPRSGVQEIAVCTPPIGKGTSTRTSSTYWACSR